MTYSRDVSFVDSNFILTPPLQLPNATFSLHEEKHRPPQSPKKQKKQLILHQPFLSKNNCADLSLSWIVKENAQTPDFL